MLLCDIRGTETNSPRRAPLDLNSTVFAQALDQLWESENSQRASGASGASDSSDATAIGASTAAYRGPGGLPILGVTSSARHEQRARPLPTSLHAARERASA